MARKYYWRGGLGAEVSIVPALTGGAQDVSGQMVGASRTGFADVLTRVRVQGGFTVEALGNGTTNNPADSWGQGLTASIGLWADGGDPTLGPPSDPIDDPDPDPPWLWTALLRPRIISTNVVPKSYLFQLDIPGEQEWSRTKRDTVFANGGTQNRLWLQWVITNDWFNPPIGVTFGGVQYPCGARFSVRSLWLKG